MKVGGVLLFVFVFLVSSSLTSASIGLSPGSYTIDFEPGSQMIFTFEFLSDVGVELDISVEGDLSEYVKLSTDRLDGSGKVNVLLELPDEIEIPGTHVLFITARERRGGETGLSVVSSLRGMINVNVPYPGKYATLGLDFKNANFGEPVTIKSYVNNLGSESISTTSFLEVRDNEGNKIEKIDLDPFVLESQKLKIVETVLETYNLKPGNYFIVNVLNYEGGEINANKSLRLGELYVQINNYSNNLIRDKINRFDVYVENYWNNKIEDVYVSVKLLVYPIEFKTPSTYLEGFGSAMLSGFFDTSTIKEDSFKAVIQVHYEDKITEKYVKLKFKKDNTVILIVIAVVSIIILIGLLLGLLIWIRNNMKRVGSGKKKVKK